MEFTNSITRSVFTCTMDVLVVLSFCDQKRVIPDQLGHVVYWSVILVCSIDGGDSMLSDYYRSVQRLLFSMANLYRIGIEN